MKFLSDLVKKSLPELRSIERIEMRIDELPRWIYEFHGYRDGVATRGVVEIVWRDGKPEIVRIEYLS